MIFFLAMASLCLASAYAAALEDLPSFHKLDNDLIKEEIQDVTTKVTEATDLFKEFNDLTTNLPDYENWERCPGGFVKDPEDNTKCINASESAFILTSFFDKIRINSLDGKKKIEVMEDLNYIDSYGFDYNIRTNTVFWFSRQENTIYSSPLRNYVNSEKQSIMHSNYSSLINGIAVDWIYNHIYWIDIFKKELVVSNFNGTMKKVLFSNGSIWPVSIVVNPLNGWMYWADGFKGHIERAGLDGSQREVIVSTTNSNPKDLALDLVENQLYWSQGNSWTGFSSIWSSNFDGSDRKMIFESTKSKLTGGYFQRIALFDKYIYLLESSSDLVYVYRVNKCNGQELEMVYNSTSYLWDLKIYHSTMQPEGENLCSKRIYQCSHFCFPVPSLGKDSANVSTTTCACPDGLYLSSDQRNCVSELTTSMPV